MTAADGRGDDGFRQAMAGAEARALMASGAALAAVGSACLFVFLGAPHFPRPSVMTASAGSPPPVVAAAVAPVPEASLPAGLPSPRAVDVAPSAQGALPLERQEVREVQARLRSFGLDPGPVDGVAGTITAGAVRRYQQERGQAKTGTIDRELLVQLRYDPAPQVAPLQPAAAQGTARASHRPVAAQAARPPARRSDPFEPLRTAGDQFSRWLQSLTH